MCACHLHVSWVGSMHADYERMHTKTGRVNDLHRSGCGLGGGCGRLWGWRAHVKPGHGEPCGHCFRAWLLLCNQRRLFLSFPPPNAVDSRPHAQINQNFAMHFTYYETWDVQYCCAFCLSFLICTIGCNYHLLHYDRVWANWKGLSEGLLFNTITRAHSLVSLSLSFLFLWINSLILMVRNVQTASDIVFYVSILV